MRNFDELERAVRELQQNLQMLSRRWQRMPKFGKGGGSSGDCSCPNAWIVFIQNGDPTSGSFQLDFDVYPSGSGSITVDFDDTGSDVAVKCLAVADLRLSASSLKFTVRGPAMPLFNGGIAIRNKTGNSSYLSDVTFDRDNVTLDAGMPYVLPLYSDIVEAS
ncbi:hypothetical protein GYB59_00520 [bacterium]|nr:hypothetical protein [bacterium]